jgi:transposase
MAVPFQTAGMARPSSKHQAFTRADRRRLGRALATADRARVYRRIAAVLAVADGQSVGAVARQTRVDRTTVHRWVDRYLAARDPNALADDGRPGRPRLRAPTDRRLLRVLTLDPRAHGYHAATWTAPLLATYCAEHFHCAVSPRTLRRRLHALGYRWKRPRYRYAHRAAHLAQKKGGSAAA